MELRTEFNIVIHSRRRLLSLEEVGGVNATHCMYVLFAVLRVFLVMLLKSALEIFFSDFSNVITITLIILTHGFAASLAALGVHTPHHHTRNAKLFFRVIKEPRATV